MPPRYAKSYIDRLYAEKDVFNLHSVIDVVGKHRELPEQFWLFSRLLEWCSSTRSGVWQYYEALPTEKFERVAGMLERYGFREIAACYRLGMSNWKGPEYCGDLDVWIDTREHELHAAALQLIENYRACLCD